VAGNPVEEIRLTRPIEIKPVAPILSNWHGDRSCSGLVIENPLRDRTIDSDGDDLSRIAHLIRGSQFWFCGLRDWHNPGVLMKRYRLSSVQFCQIEGFSAFHIVCDWD